MVRKAEVGDVQIVAALARMLWPDNALSAMEELFAELIPQKEAAVFLAYHEKVPVGFAQCQLRRDYVEGTDSSPVGYLEGVFVKEEMRRCGYARVLLSACEDWARTMGCRGFASDCELENADSLRFHLSTGFEEAGRIICFTKKL